MKALESFTTAFRGIGILFLEERNFRIELAFAEIVTAGLYLLSFPPVLTALATLAMGMVMAGEGANAVIERTLDIFGERSERIREAKDVAAGAVLIMGLTALALAIDLAWGELGMLWRDALGEPALLVGLVLALILTFAVPRKRRPT